jgi:hypothetical protein
MYAAVPRMIVRGFECFRDLQCDGQRFVDWNGSARDLLCEIFAFDQLHDQRGDAA